jgi:inorganic pyrophosphatase
LGIYDKDFWQALDMMLEKSNVVIDRPKGTCHPKYFNMKYLVDYGYLQGTSSMDGAGIDVWRGTDKTGKINAVICIVDLIKNDSEIKLLLNCTDEEKNSIYHFHNQSKYMKGILINREAL